MALVTLSNAKQFDCPAESTLLDAAKLHGMVLEHSCRTGRCGVCKCKVISGATQAIKSEESLTHDEIEAGFILTCARTALEDASLDIEDLGNLANIQIQTLPCRIDSLEHLAPDVVKIMLRLPPKNTFQYLPGQYINVIGKNGVRRSYSIANSPHVSDKIELHIREVPTGEMSAYWFNEATANDLLRFEGPYGTFCFHEKPQKHIVFLATGTGIAPVKSILEEMSANAVHWADKQIHVYWGGRKAEDIYWHPEFDQLNISFHPTLSRAHEQWTGRRGYVQDRLVADAIPVADAVVYACGSDQMIHSAQALLLAQGLNPKNFYADAFVSSK